MRRVSNKKVVELASQGKASYEDGSKPKAIISVEDVAKSIQNLIAKADLDVTNSNNEVLLACNEIIEGLKDKPEPFDNSKLDIINSRMVTIIQMLSKPKEWDFEIERDMMGEITNVNAKQVMH